MERLYVALRPHPTTNALALSIGLTLVAATAVAPKNLFWNHVPAIVGAAVLAAPIVGRQGPVAAERALLVGWYGLALFGMGLDGLAASRDLGPLGAVASGAPLLGLLALWTAIAARVGRAGPAGTLTGP